MSSTYDFLRDAFEVRRFVELFVTDLGDDEALILMLMARRKYLSDDKQKSLSIGNSVVFRRDAVQNDGMLPVPGTSHDGAVPRMLDPIHTRTRSPPLQADGGGRRSRLVRTAALLSHPSR